MRRCSCKGMKVVEGDVDGKILWSRGYGDRHGRSFQCHVTRPIHAPIHDVSCRNLKHHIEPKHLTITLFLRGLQGSSKGLLPNYHSLCRTIAANALPLRAQPYLVGQCGSSALSLDSEPTALRSPPAAPIFLSLLQVRRLLPSFF